MSKNEIMQPNTTRGYLELAKRILNIARRKVTKEQKAQEIAKVLEQLVQVQEVATGITIEHTLEALQGYIVETVTPEQKVTGTPVYEYGTLYGIFTKDSNFTVGFEEVSWFNEKAILREVNTNKHLVDLYRIDTTRDENIAWRNEDAFQVGDEEAYALPITSIVPKNFIVDYGRKQVIKGNVLEDLQKEVNIYLNHDKEFVTDVFTKKRTR